MSMTTVEDFLVKNPLGKSEGELRRLQGLAHFSDYLQPTVDDIWPKVLSTFATTRPLTYWNKPVLDQALSVLEIDPRRTLQALTTWYPRVGLGIEYLLRLSPAAADEGSYSATTGIALTALANTFHPEYLRRCEHIFTNLITVYWAILKRGGVAGKFGISGAAARITTTGQTALLSGYDENVRNAIAHGEVTFEGNAIRYGLDVSTYRLSTYDFFDRFDAIWQTTLSLTIALIVFIARHSQNAASNMPQLPTAIVTLIAAAELNHGGMSVVGLAESVTVRGGKQLHISVRSAYRKRAALLLECSRLSLQLLRSGASDYARYLFEIDQGGGRTSMSTILPDKLGGLISTNAPFEQIGAIFDEGQLLWYDESQASMFMKNLWLSFSSGTRLGWYRWLSSAQAKGHFATQSKYEIRKIENTSAGGIARVKALVVLRNRADADSHALIRNVIRSVVQRLSWSLMETNPSRLGKHLNHYARPEYVWVQLYKSDGPIRWLQGCGWPSGNLIAEGELIRGRQLQPIFVKKPDEIWRDLRLRFSMDTEAAAKAIVGVLEFQKRLERTDPKNSANNDT